MEKDDKFGALKDAISKADVEVFARLISSMDSLSLRDLLKNQNEDLISYAVHLGRQELAIKLLVMTYEDAKIPFEKITWLKLFDLVSAPHASSTQIIERLKYAAPLISKDNFPLTTLAHKPKYLKAAFALGAVCTDASALGSAIMTSCLQFKDKIKLLQWLKDNNYVTHQIVPTSEVRRFIIQSPEFEEYLKSYPDGDWILEKDPLTHNNILHEITRHDKVRVSSFNRTWSILKKICPDKQKLITAALQRNSSGVVPAIAYLSKYLGNSSTPVEFLNALKIIVEQDEINQAWMTYTEHHMSYDTQNLKYGMLYCYLLQHGQPHNTQHLRRVLQRLFECDDLHQLFHVIDKPKKEEELSESANITINGSDSHHTILFDLPKELFEEIIIQLTPHDLTRLYSCSKTLHEEFKTILFNQDEQFWRHYHVKYFKHVEDVTLPYRTRVQRLLKLNSSWRKNKYSAVAEMKGKPQLINDNWIIMSNHLANEYYTSYNTTPVAYWNCHTQSFANISVTSSVHKFCTILKDTTESASAPKVLVSEYKSLQNFFLKILSEKESAPLKNVPDDNYRSLRVFEDIVSITENQIFFPYAGCVFNIEYETVTAQLPKFDFDSRTIYNPFNKTFVTVSSYGNDYYAITDIRTNNTVKVPRKTLHPMTITFTKIVDEHTLFIMGQCRNHMLARRYTYASACSFVDLRTGSETNRVKHVFTNTYANVPCSNERLFIHTQNAPIVSSWHLPSRKIEWLQPTEHIPKMANARYLVLSDRDDTTTYVRDYLSWGSEEADLNLKL